MLGEDTSELQRECAGYFVNIYNFLKKDKRKSPNEVMDYLRRLLKERETNSDPAAYKNFLFTFQHLVYNIIHRIKTNMSSLHEAHQAHINYNATIKAVKSSFGSKTGPTDDDFVDIAQRKEDEELLLGKEEDSGDVSNDEDDDGAVEWGDVIETQNNLLPILTLVPGTNGFTIFSSALSLSICRTIKAAIKLMTSDTRAREVWNDPMIPLYVPS